ncbi:MAG: O-antigen ligase family protein [Defluviitaleaceae bacterium]|nr:O-antigen ligase family protein [Defluviitaleaceae bacterium]
MGTQSVVIQKIHAFLLWANVFFEHSLIFRGLSAIGNAARGSAILSGFLHTERDYWGGSLIMRGVSLVFGGIYRGAAWIFAVLSRANENSVNRKIFLACKNALADPNNLLNKTVAECVPGRVMDWFFGDEKARQARIGHRGHVSASARSLEAGCNSMSEKSDAPVTVLSFINLKTVYMLFLVGSLTIPSHMWNNWLLFISAAFFAGAYFVKLLLDENGSRFRENVDASDMRLRGKAASTPTKIYISPALILFVFFCAFSMLHGYGGMDSVRVFVIFFACIVHSVLVSQIIKKSDMRLFFSLAAVALVIAAAIGFYHVAMGIEVRTDLTDLQASPGLSRLYATLGGNPNNDAQAWAMLLPFVIAAMICVKNDTRRLVLLMIIFTVLGAFAMTYSRGGYVALGAGLAVFILLAAPRLIPIVFLAGILALPIIPPGIIERLFTLGQDSSSQYRFMIWGGVMRMLEDFWVQGIGMGPAAFIRIYRSYAHPLAERAMHSHNMFLDIITHSGIGALVAFLAYLYGLFKRGIAAHASEVEPENKVCLAAGIAALTVFVALGVGEYVWFYPRVMLVFWIMTGLLTGLSLKTPPKLRILEKISAPSAQ